MEIKETDKDVLKRVVAHPTFREIIEALQRERAKAKGKLDRLRAK